MVLCCWQLLTGVLRTFDEDWLPDISDVTSTAFLLNCNITQAGSSEHPASSNTDGVLRCMRHISLAICGTAVELVRLGVTACSVMV